MGQYIKLFETHAEYTAFTQTEDFLLPNVSYCEDQTDVVHYNPIPTPETRVIATFNVASAGNVKLYGYRYYESSPSYNIYGVDLFDTIEIDGNEVNVSTLDSASGLYNMSAGQHTVAYTLKDETSILSNSFKGADFNSVTIPDGVTDIYEGAFNSCPNLTTVTIPESVVYIGTCSFADSNNLDNATISAVTAINSNALTCID